MLNGQKSKQRITFKGANDRQIRFSLKYKAFSDFSHDILTRNQVTVKKNLKATLYKEEKHAAGGRFYPVTRLAAGAIPAGGDLFHCVLTAGKTATACAGRETGDGLPIKRLVWSIK